MIRSLTSVPIETAETAPITSACVGATSPGITRPVWPCRLGSGDAPSSVTHACAIASATPRRCLGSLVSSPLSSACSRASWLAAQRDGSGKASGSCWILSYSSTSPDARKGASPNAKNHSVTPSAHTSAALPSTDAATSVHSSGAVKVGEPATVVVSSLASAAPSAAAAAPSDESDATTLAIPKSAILRVPLDESSRFSGLRSRCSTPLRWRYSSPVSTSRQYERHVASSKGARPSWRVVRITGPRETYSITMKSFFESGESITSSSRTTLGWSIFFITAISVKMSCSAVPEPLLTFLRCSFCTTLIAYGLPLTELMHSFTLP